MIIDKTNKIDISLGSKRYISDEHPGITVISNLENNDVSILIENPVDFSTIESIESIEKAIKELKLIVLKNE